MNWFYWFLKFVVVGPALHLFFGIKVRGLQNLPKRGPVIVASNHLSAIDSFFIPIALPRKLTFLAKAAYFQGRGPIGRFVAWFLLAVGQIPLDRSGGAASSDSLNTGLQALSEGKALGIYPEGTRSPTGNLYRGKTGIARMVLASGVPVVPISVSGTNEIMPKGARLPRFRRVTVTVGDPLDFSRFHGLDNDRFILRAVTDEVMLNILALGKQDYVDVYASTIKQNDEFDPQRAEVTAAAG
ncbi:MAG TPA: lysophospholipid acyltransferase family protein [Galbitalea sp.]|jgi:1-acyl-sn-glycerol-3-phosphate acyltransferase|nr:lysophospholipid acyltransferase family protein [Galbitalea sp.]